MGIDSAGMDPRGGTRPVPEAWIELQVQLRVGSIAQLGDGRLLETVEAGLAVIQGSQDTEWEGQDHPVEGGCVCSAGCGEGQRGTPVAVVDDGLHFPVEVDVTDGETLVNGRCHPLDSP